MLETTDTTEQILNSITSDLPVDTSFLSSIDFASYIPVIIGGFTKLLIFILGLYFGFKAITKVTTLLKKVLNKQRFDRTLTGFLTSIVANILKVLLVLSLVTYIGIPTTSFVAILGAAGLAVGMALSGTLQNFAGGAMLLAFRPFKVGDYVELSGYAGTVSEIQIFNTILTTPDNKKIIIPNAECSSSSMVNFSALPKRRIDFTVGIGYDDNIDAAKEVLKKIADADSRIIDKKETLVAVSDLGASSVDLAFRVWVKGSDYWDVKFDTTETIKKEFDTAGISFPYPQQDIHLYQK